MGSVFDPQTSLAFWTIVTFLILLALLWKFVYPPIAEQIKQRQEAIERAIDEAENTRAEAKRLLEEYRSQLAEARQESRRILEEARKQSEAQSERQTKEAREEGERIIQRALAEIERERDRMLKEVRQEIADMVIMASEQVVGKTLDRADHEKLIEEALRELETEVAPAGRK